MLIPALLLILLFMGIPALYMILYSFSRLNMSTLTFQFYGINNYAQMLSDSVLGTSIVVTLTYALISVIGSILLALGISLLLFRPIGINTLARTIILLPFVVAPVVNGVIWRMMLFPGTGLISQMLQPFGLGNAAWLGTGAALYVVAFVDVWMGTPIVVLMLLAGLKSLPTDPIEAARIDGASDWQIIRYVTIPLLMPILAFAIIWRTIWSIKAFDLIYIMTLGGPGYLTTSMYIWTWDQGFIAFNVGYAASLAILILAVNLVLTGGMIKLSTKGGN
jgi:multiple sugar transport system permease protein